MERSSTRRPATSVASVSSSAAVTIAVTATTEPVSAATKPAPAALAVACAAATFLSGSPAAAPTAAAAAAALPATQPARALAAAATLARAELSDEHHCGELAAGRGRRAVQRPPQALPERASQHTAQSLGYTATEEH